jgi:hypothetical protein
MLPAARVATRLVGTQVREFTVIEQNGVRAARARTATHAMEAFAAGILFTA